MIHLGECQQRLREYFESYAAQMSANSLYHPVRYILSLGGKRLRPSLCLLATDLFKGDLENACHAAAAIEVFHNFTLMHDDIMDDAPLRRGKATVHEKWDSNSAILSGDAMLVMAYELIARSGSQHLPEVLQIFNQTALEVCEGQQADMEFESREDVSIEEYLEMIRLKTSVLLAASLKIGAILGGASTEDADHLYVFGEKLGMSFQLRDDYLDAFGDAEKFGKQVGGDILARKKTYLLLRTIEKASTEQNSELRSLMSAGSSDVMVEGVKDIMKQTGASEDLLRLSDELYEESLSHLREVSSDEASKTELYAFAKLLHGRDH